MGLGTTFTQGHTITESLNNCSEKVREKNSIKNYSERLLQQCVAKKFEDPTNKFESESLSLKEMRDNTNLYGDYNIVPSMFIDGNLVRGKLQGHAAVSAICDSLKTKPKVCSKIHTILKGEIEANYITELPTEYKYIWVILFVLFIASSFIVMCLLFLFKVNFNTQLRSQIYQVIEGSISDYQKINDLSATNKDSTLRADNL